MHEMSYTQNTAKTKSLLIFHSYWTCVWVFQGTFCSIHLCKLTDHIGTKSSEIPDHRRIPWTLHTRTDRGGVGRWYSKTIFFFAHGYFTWHSREKKSAKELKVVEVKKQRIKTILLVHYQNLRVKTPQTYHVILVRNSAFYISDIVLFSSSIHSFICLLFFSFLFRLLLLVEMCSCGWANRRKKKANEHHHIKSRTHTCTSFGFWASVLAACCLSDIFRWETTQKESLEWSKWVEKRWPSETQSCLNRSSKYNTSCSRKRWMK